MKQRFLLLSATVVMGLCLVAALLWAVAPAQAGPLAAPGGTALTAGAEQGLFATQLTTRTLGTGTTASNYPFYTYYKNGKSQMLYLGSEIGFSGPIRRVAFDISRVGATYRTLPNFTIRMMEVTATAFSAAYLDASAATVVYGGTGYSETLPSVLGWAWFDITDFSFHPDKNLLVEITWGTLPAYESTYYQVNGSTTTAYQTVYGYSDSTYPPGYSGRTYTRPNLRLEMDAEAVPIYTTSSKTVQPAGVRAAGSTVTYTVVMSNTGLVAGTPTLTDTLPTGATYVPGSATGGAVYSDALNAVLWGPVSLAVGNSMTVTFQVTLTAINGYVTNTATLSDTALAAPVLVSAGNAINTADFSSSTNAANPGSNIHPTGPLTYTVVVFNSAAAITATATLTDPIPAGASYRPGSAQVQGGGTLLADTAGITWTGTVTGGQKITVTFGVSLTALSGNVTNTAYMNSPYINALVTKGAVVSVQPYSGGPDSFGYTYQDSYMPGGPAYTWVPTTTAAITLVIYTAGDSNDGYWTVDLPFPFAFYTNIYTQVFPSTNGLVSFGAGSTASSNVTIPTAGAPNNFAACYWDDLRIASTNPITEGVFYEVQGIAPHRQAIFTFVLEDTYYSSGAYPPYRFQMSLSEGTNQITCQYQQMTSAAARGDGRSATLGLENVSGTGGLLYFHGSGTTFPAPVEDRLAMRYSPPQRPNYAFAKTALPASLLYPGQLITYSLAITNYGAANGTALLRDPLPAGVSYAGAVSGDPNPPSFDGTTVSWTAPVGAAQTAMVRFVASVLPSFTGYITNTATLSDTLIPAALTAQAVNQVAVPQYTTSSKAVTPSGTVATGQLLTYTLSLNNSGALSGTATLIDALPAGAAYVPGSATVISGGGTLVASTTTVTWTGTVTNGAGIQVRLNATVSGLYGVVTNTAVITDLALAAPVYISAPGSTIASPNLTASTQTANPAAVQAGGGLTYVVQIKNTGALPTSSASLSDALPAQVSADPARLAASSGSVTGTASAVSWTGAVAAGASVYVTIPVTVSNSCCDQALVNTAVISEPTHPAPVSVASAPVSVYGVTALLSEGFEGAFPPADWTSVVVTAVSSPAWTQVITGDYPVIPTGPYAGADMAKFNSFSVSSGGAARLSTPAIDLTGASGPVLVFAMYHDPGYATAADSIQIQVSTDGGSTYSNIGAPIVRYATTAGWGVHAVDLSAYSGQSLRVGFLAISAYGNNMFIDAVEVYACGLAPQGVSFTYSPLLPLTGQAVDFTGVVLTSAVPVTYTWNFGDGAPEGTGNPLSHTYALSGTYPAVMTAANAFGWTTYTLPITIIAASVSPSVTLTSSGPTFLGNPTYFTATLTAGTPPITYTWDFGDGTMLNNGLTLSHTYAAGSYTATLTATNTSGWAQATTLVVILANDYELFLPLTIRQ